MPPGKSHRPRHRTIRHIKIEERLDLRHHGELKARLLDPGVNQQAVMRWLASLGCRTSQASICRYRQHLFAEQMRALREAEEAEDAASQMLAYVRLARQPNPPDFTHGSEALCRMLLFESLMLLQSSGTTEGLHRLAQYGDALTAVNQLGRRFPEIRVRSVRARRRRRKIGRA